MGEFIDHPNKKIIRELWCKPILEHIHVRFGYQLVYLGLPGLDAIDLLTWIQHIKYVIAVDCGHYTKSKFDLTLARENIKRLNLILNDLDRKGEISGYSLYLGYIEEIILKGYDLNGAQFNQKDIVNIYNLDFCNSLTVPLEITDLKGGIKIYYKNEVIRRLLEYERDLDKPDKNKRFVMFVTIHTKFWEDEAEKYFKSKVDSSFKDYQNSLRGINGSARVVRLLRYYCIDILRQHFTSSSFIPFFLPTIIYDGAGQNQLMCFTIIGKYLKQPSAIAPWYQKIDSLIHQKFLFPNKNRIDILKSPIVETNPLLDPVKQLEDSLLFLKR